MLIVLHYFQLPGFAGVVKCPATANRCEPVPTPPVTQPAVASTTPRHPVVPGKSYIEASVHCL